MRARFVPPWSKASSFAGSQPQMRAWRHAWRLCFPDILCSYFDFLRARNRTPHAVPAERLLRRDLESSLSLWEQTSDLWTLQCLRTGLACLGPPVLSLISADWRAGGPARAAVTGPGRGHYPLRGRPLRDRTPKSPPSHPQPRFNRVAGSGIRYQVGGGCGGGRGRGGGGGVTHCLPHRARRPSCLGSRAGAPGSLAQWPPSLQLPLPAITRAAAGAQGGGIWGWRVRLPLLLPPGVGAGESGQSGRSQVSQIATTTRTDHLTTRTTNVEGAGGRALARRRAAAGRRTSILYSTGT